MAEVGSTHFERERVPPRHVSGRNDPALIGCLVDALGQGAGTRTLLRNVLPHVSALAGAAKAAFMVWHVSPWRRKS